MWNRRERGLSRTGRPKLRSPRVEGVRRCNLVPQRRRRTGRVPTQPDLRRRRFGAGKVVEVAHGEEERGADQPLDPQDPDADWRHVGVTVEIDEGWGPAAREKTAEFVVNINGGVDAAFRASVETWGRIVAVLRQPIPGSPSGDAFRIPHAGTLVGLVADDSSISLPLMEPSEAERFLGTVRTVDDLRSEAAKKPVVIDRAAQAG